MPEDRKLLGAVISSVSFGPPLDWSLPRHGRLERIVSLSLELIDELEEDEKLRPDGGDEAEAQSRAGHSAAGVSGSAFYVDAAGAALTNAHVVSSCTDVSVAGLPYDVAALDERFDLALLRSRQPRATPSFVTFAARPARINSDVIAAGFPLADLLGGANVTRGTVTALSGLHGDATRMQISAPVQPGASGGPVFDRNGLVVGVVVAKLDAARVADLTGDIPQNINFAVRAEIAKLFLAAQGVAYAQSDRSTGYADPSMLAEEALKSTARVTCR